MKPEEVQQIRKILRKKADNANEGGTLTPEEQKRIEKAFPDLKLKPVMPKLPSMKSMPSQFDEDDEESQDKPKPFGDFER